MLSSTKFTLIFLVAALTANRDSAQVDMVAETEAAITKRVSSYLNVLTVERYAEAASDYYTEDARLLGPGMDLDRSGVVEGLRSVFGSGMEVQVDRRTLELYVHGDTAYEIAQDEVTILSPDGSSDTMQNTMFIRRQKGTDGQWRFARVLLSPQGSTDQ
jgi:ketosteroid isomerase-like protein